MNFYRRDRNSDNKANLDQLSWGSTELGNHQYYNSPRYFEGVTGEEDHGKLGTTVTGTIQGGIGRVLGGGNRIWRSSMLKQQVSVDLLKSSNFFLILNKQRKLSEKVKCFIQGSKQA